MPPGWTKAVNSKTLMDSFAKVDRLLKKRDRNDKICEDCSGYFSKKEEFSDKKTKIIMDVLENINCQDYSQEQMAQILFGLTQLTQTGKGDLKIVKNVKPLSALYCSTCCSSPSLLHFSKSDLVDLCSPSVRSLVSLLSSTYHDLIISILGTRQSGI